LWQPLLQPQPFLYPSWPQAGAAAQVGAGAAQVGAGAAQLGAAQLGAAAPHPQPTPLPQPLQPLQPLQRLWQRERQCDAQQLVSQPQPL
jgi:hypothetical protein